MFRTGHLGLAMLAWAPIGWAIATVGGCSTLALAGGLATLGLADAPDLDHDLPFVEHRGPTHSLSFALGVAAIAGVGGFCIGSVAGTAGIELVGDLTSGPPSSAGAAVGAAAGATAVTSHLAGDALTPTGVSLLWPLSRRRYAVPLADAGSPALNGSALVAGLGATGVVAASVTGVGPTGIG